jgi:hypothetical protein
MNIDQKGFVKKVALNIALVILIAVVAIMINELLPAGWLTAHHGTVEGIALLLFIVVGALAQREGPLPSRAEQHAALNRVYDEHPWAKVYLALYCMALALGLYLVGTHHIDLAKVGFLGLLGVVLLLMLPVFLIKLKEAYDAAGEEE